MDVAPSDLAKPVVRAALQLIWTDPLALDPSRRSAKVTREIAGKLGSLAQLLERSGHRPEAVAAFLMRAHFTMFAEDVELLPKNSFFDLLSPAAPGWKHSSPRSRSCGSG